MGFWVGLRARDFPTERVLSRTPLIIRTVDHQNRGDASSRQRPPSPALLNPYLITIATQYNRGAKSPLLYLILGCRKQKECEELVSRASKKRRRRKQTKCLYACASESRESARNLQDSLLALSFHVCGREAQPPLAEKFVRMPTKQVFLDSSPSGGADERHRRRRRRRRRRR